MGLNKMCVRDLKGGICRLEEVGVGVDEMWMNKGRSKLIVFIALFLLNFVLKSVL